MKIKFSGDKTETHIFKVKARCTACGFIDELKTNNPLLFLKIIFSLNKKGICPNCNAGPEQ